jgi:hypothetical protein
MKIVPLDSYCLLTIFGPAEPRVLGRNVSDEFTVPLCRDHHRQLHHHGNEVAWWANVHIAPLEVAKSLWDQTLSGMASDIPHRLAAEFAEAAK